MYVHIIYYHTLRGGQKKQKYCQIICRVITIERSVADVFLYVNGGNHIHTGFQTWGRVHFHKYEYEYIGDWRVRVRVHLWWMGTSTSTFYTSTSTFPWVFSRMMTYTIIQAITRTNSHTSIVAYTYPVRACVHPYIIMSYDDIAQFFQTC